MDSAFVDRAWDKWVTGNVGSSGNSPTRFFFFFQCLVVWLCFFFWNLIQEVVHWRLLFWLTTTLQHLLVSYQQCKSNLILCFFFSRLVFAVKDRCFWQSWIWVFYLFAELSKKGLICIQLSWSSSSISWDVAIFLPTPLFLVPTSVSYLLSSSSFFAWRSVVVVLWFLIIWGLRIL